MGLWGASQAIGFALGGFLGAVAIDISRALIAEVALAYGLVFSLEAALFVCAAVIGLRIEVRPSRAGQRSAPGFGDVAMVEVLDAR